MKPSIIPIEDESTEERAFAPLAALGRHLLRAQFARLRHGEIRLVDERGEQRYGERSARCPFTTTIEVLDPQFYADATFGGTVGAGDLTLDNATVKCWGANHYGQLGNGSSNDSAVPVSTLVSGFTALSVGPVHVCDPYTHAHGLWALISTLALPPTPRIRSTDVPHFR